MGLYQYIGEGHTLIRTMKAAKEKVKVAYGEIIELEDGLFEDGRLMLGGFQKIVEGAGEIVDALKDAAGDIKNAVVTVEEVLTNGQIKEKLAALGVDYKSAKNKEQLLALLEANTPSDPSMQDAPAEQAPVVTVEVVNDGSQEITVEVQPAN